MNFETIIPELPITMIEPEDSKKPLVIYHANCADGFAAAWCFWQMHKDNYEYYPGVYQEAPPDCTGRIVYLVDFSYKANVVEKMLDVAEHVILIDHHKTAIDDLSDLGSTRDNFSAYLSLEKSGAMLSWDYLMNTRIALDHGIIESFIDTEDYMEPPRLLLHIQDRDLWKFELPSTREIQAALFSYPYEFDLWDDLINETNKTLEILAAEGVAIERKHHKDIAELVKICERTMLIGDSVVPVASMPYTYSSDAAHLMAKNYNEGNNFAACYWDTREGRIFSLRSTEWGADVSIVAAQYGGGGHKHAAGFSVPRGHRLSVA